MEHRMGLAQAVTHPHPGIALENFCETQRSINVVATAAGFCGETDEEHAATVNLMKTTRFDTAFMFAYSQRAKTAAARHQQVHATITEEHLW